MAYLQLERSSVAPEGPPSGLRDCPIIDMRLFHQRGADDPIVGAEPSQSEGIVAPARRFIFRQRDRLDIIPCLYRGWAACSVALSDGRRQILSFLLPGDIAPTALVFDNQARFSLEAITEVAYRPLRIADFRAGLTKDPGQFEQFSKIWADEKRRADELAIDLGRRGADERVARLLISLVARLRQRGLSEGETVTFPLRQHHIADATGLTSVHVSKVLTQFRRAGYIEIKGRTLTILNQAAFNAIAGIREFNGQR